MRNTMGRWANPYYGSLAVGRTRAILRARSALLTNIMKVTSHLGGKLPALRVQAFLLSSLGKKKEHGAASGIRKPLW